MEIARLGLEQRASVIRQMTEQTFDVVVIGGGVTGAGTALDAATRGLSVALLEAGDLASGTSSRSGKTFHGGLRYLPQLNFSLVRQAAHERNLMFDRLCPHLARSTTFLFPLRRGMRERAYVGAGIFLYDLLGGKRPEGMSGHRHFSRTQALQEMPALDAERVTGAIQYSDVIFDDARHTMLVARTAAHYGALIGTRLRVTGMLHEHKKIVGVRACDLESGQELEVRGRCVISATGAWTDLVQQLAGEVQVKIEPAKGVHIVVPKDCIDSRTGFIVPAADSVLVVRPWWQYWIIGTTDTPWQYERDDPAANADDINYLLTEVNKWLHTPLTLQDVVGVYAGIRPLISGKGSSTAALHRDHAVLKSPEGLLTIVGGKYTTYRVMSKDVMDAAVSQLDRAAPSSVTERTPLLGAEGWHALHNQQQRFATQTGLSLQHIDHLLKRYGSLVSELFALLIERPELARPIEGASEYLEVEAFYAASHEGALHLDDVLMRRTHIAIETRDHGLTAARRVAELLAEVLDWNNAQCEQEIAHYQSLVEADQRSAQEFTDAAAVAARSPIPWRDPF